MVCRALGLIAALGVSVGYCDSAFAQPVPGFRFVAIDVGVPTDGTRVMTGYRGYVVRAESRNGDLIAGIDLATNFGIFGAVYGGLAQRWTDPTATGNYTVTSPGPFPDARNDRGPSELNFDSHYLFRPEEVTVERIRESGAPGIGFITRDNLDYPNFNPIPSTPTVGYGTALSFPTFLTDYGMLEADYTYLPEFRRLSVDVAYVVSNTSFGVVGGVISDRTGINEVVSVFVSVPPDVPEPSWLACVATLLATSHVRPRRVPACGFGPTSSRSSLAAS